MSGLSVSDVILIKYFGYFMWCVRQEVMKPYISMKLPLFTIMRIKTSDLNIQSCCFKIRRRERVKVSTDVKCAVAARGGANQFL